ncbi:MAG TPA: cytochrome c3 family protein [Myxococcales bacterium]|nr:cytochrome c3 family protein [Myxococcales bacterium]
MLASLAAVVALSASFNPCRQCHWMPAALAAVAEPAAAKAPSKTLHARLLALADAKATAAEPAKAAAPVPGVKLKAKAPKKAAPAKAVEAKPAEAKPAAAKAPAAPEKVVLPSSPPVVSAPRALAEQPSKGADLFKCTACHASLTDGRKPHNPLKGGTCEACHVANPGAVGKCRSPQGTAWKLVAEQPALCQKCHDTSGASTPHPVIKAQGCTACHDPHASKNPTLLKISPVDALCYKCHAKYDDAEFIHTAVKQGKCLGCHSPHQGDAAPLLVDKREVLCFGCHKEPELAKTHGKHQPFIDGKCLSCHDPHRADVKGQLVEKGKKLCLTCHAKDAKPGPATASMKFRIDLTKKVVHKALTQGDCQDCHSAQGPLTRQVQDVCFKCHTKFDELYKFQHGAAKLGDCAVCHDPHSSNNKALLVSDKINQVCFTCHQDDATKQAWVHKPILSDKGCTSCHDAHGGDFKFNLADAEGPDLCLKCHTPMQAKMKVKVPHKALVRYGCTACHDPHASAQQKGLVKPVNDLCISCHKAQADGAHTGIGHKVEGGPDPRRTGQPFSCISCHDPHGTDNPKLFRSGANAQESCKGCHRDKEVFR